MSGRSSYIGRDADGKAIWVPTGSEEHLTYLAGITPERSNFIADEGSFVSPIDGKTYSGRAGMREHNKRHDVVNNRDLQGLPYRNFGAPPPPDRKAIRNAIIEAGKRLGHL